MFGPYAPLEPIDPMAPRRLYRMGDIAGLGAAPRITAGYSSPMIGLANGLANGMHGHLAADDERRRQEALGIPQQPTWGQQISEAIRNMDAPDASPVVEVPALFGGESWT